jgi:hypothetical protein
MVRVLPVVQAEELLGHDVSALLRPEKGDAEDADICQRTCQAEFTRPHHPVAVIACGRASAGSAREPVGGEAKRPSMELLRRPGAPLQTQRHSD